GLPDRCGHLFRFPPEGDGAVVMRISPLVVHLSSRENWHHLNSTSGPGIPRSRKKGPRRAAWGPFSCLRERSRTSCAPSCYRDRASCTTVIAWALMSRRTTSLGRSGGLA